MDQLNHDSFCQPIQGPNQFATDLHQPPPLPAAPPTRHHSESSQMPGAEKENTVARKVQKADREKLRRDRLNEQFWELGKVLDPDRPKNDKASILADTVQVVKDLTAQVNRLKAEFATLTEESRELSQEKNDLREEKASLKSEIENLNTQYQQRLTATFPWGAIDHSVVMHPPYPMPVPVPMPMPTGPIPMHPSMQPYPFFRTQNHGVNPCSTFVPYVTHNSMIEPQFTQPGARSHVSSKHDAKDKLSDREREISTEKNEDSNDVTTDLELKTPGCATNADSSSPLRKTKKSAREENGFTDGSSSSKCSSSHSVQDSSSSSVVGGGKADD